MVKSVIEQGKAVTKTALPLMEDFYTVQGEGVYTGHAAYFIRLAGCDVGCVWCDVKESWDEEAHPTVKVEDIVSKAAAMPGRLAVITGGEPLMHDISYLTQKLKEAGFQVNIETSGAHPLSGDLDWITFSPKKFKQPLPEIYEKAHELKVVVFNKSDFAFAEEFAEKMAPDCKLYLQPEWSKHEKMMPLIVDYVKENPKWHISLQTHKFMQIP
ncbi:7-carboxy-7-deazaguanine synthase QueE [Limibacter armeniacum]|uniref:7-carboxy-7-deazaguanine synthase QueE n=1 Tax=Limibacter armeniacum TaxID=466084 RepID=UPI002FE502F8